MSKDISNFGRSANGDIPYDAPDIEFQVILNSNHMSNISTLSSMRDVTRLSKDQTPLLAAITLSGPKYWFPLEIMNNMTDDDPNLDVYFNHNSEANKTTLHLCGAKLHNPTTIEGQLSNDYDENNKPLSTGDNSNLDPVIAEILESTDEQTNLKFLEEEVLNNRELQAYLNSDQTHLSTDIQFLLPDDGMTSAPHPIKLDEIAPHDIEARANYLLGMCVKHKLISLRHAISVGYSSINNTYHTDRHENNDPDDYPSQQP